MKIKQWTLSLLSLSCATISHAGYYQASNLASMSNKYVPSGTVLNNQTLPMERLATLSPNGPVNGVGQVANTQFGNNGPGMAGCGISQDLAAAVYGIATSKNYIALNVYSHLMGYDVAAPIWNSTSGENGVKGYVTFTPGKFGYPYQQYLRNMPALYPAYQGLWNNGLNCQRWVQVKTSAQSCNDASGNIVAAASKACQNPPASTYNASTFNAYVFDSCEDNNGWCRDDDAHIDIDQDIISDNYYLSWQFIKNPNYTNSSVPANLKDVWLAWYGQAQKWWSYLAVLNLPEGMSTLQYNIGNTVQPVWINSHVLEGDNNFTWSGSSGNGDLWQVQPMNSLTDSQPSDNPIYQVRLFDVNGYPVNGGKIYQFDLNTMNTGISVDNHAYTIAYPGQSITGGLNNTTFIPPVGSSGLQITLNGLTNGIMLSGLTPVLMNAQGFSYPANCNGNVCVFTHIPTGNYTLYGLYNNDLSKDLVVRQSQQLSLHLPVTVSAGFNTVLINITDPTYAPYVDFATTYTGVAQIQLSVQSLLPPNSANGNFQAFFVPTNLPANVTAQTQGCFLRNYAVSSGITSTNCYLYYTVHAQNGFASIAPMVNFTEVLPNSLGAGNMTYTLNSAGSPNGQMISVTGYTGDGTTQPKVSAAVGVATYSSVSGAPTQHSLLWMLDPNSDAVCLRGMNSLKVSVPSLSLKPIPLLSNQIGQLIPSTITSTDSTPAAALTMVSGAANCSVFFATPQITPGQTVVEVIKVVQNPEIPLPPPATPGTVILTAIENDGTQNCIGQIDNGLAFTPTVSGIVPYIVGQTKTVQNVLSGTYQISDIPFPVNGGSCQVVAQSANVAGSGQNTPVQLVYRYQKTPAASCTYSYTASPPWPIGNQFGSTVQMVIHNTSTQTLPATWNLQLTNTNVVNVIGSPWGWQNVIVSGGNMSGSALAGASIPAGGSVSLGENVQMASSPFKFGTIMLNGSVCTRQ